ncbi:serine/arginine (SR)-type shuttling mRNA binding protein Hrb1p [Monosporozyma unispora]
MDRDTELRDYQRSRSRSPSRREDRDNRDDPSYGDRRSRRGDHPRGDSRRGDSRRGNNYERDNYRSRDDYRRRDSFRSRDDYRSRHDYGSRDDFRPRDNYSREWGQRDNGRYRDRGYNSRGRQDYRMRGRYQSNRGDYGPVLAKELDSSYDEKVHRNYANSIFVGNLTYNCTPDDLKEHFSGIGEVVRADIITSRGHHRGMGTVEFTNTRDVDEAIRQFDGSYYMDRSIFVRQDNPPPESKRERPQNRRSENDFRKEINRPSFSVRVENLPYSINWQALKDMFKECGEVSRADVDVDGRGYSQGTGVVVFPDEAVLKKAIEMYNNCQIDGKTLSVTAINNSAKVQTEDPEAQQPSPSPMVIDQEATSTTESATKFTEGYDANGERNNFIFCSNLPDSTAKSDLFDLFGTIGPVTNAELRYDASGNPTGIAVIEYGETVDADTCIERLNNYNYGGCDLNISYAKKS